jgi:hypothetical protein
MEIGGEFSFGVSFYSSSLGLSCAWNQGQLAMLFPSFIMTYIFFMLKKATDSRAFFSLSGCIQESACGAKQIACKRQRGKTVFCTRCRDQKEGGLLKAFFQAGTQILGTVCLRYCYGLNHPL